MRDDVNNIVYEKVLSTQYAANIEVLNVKGIAINLHSAYWFSIFLPIKSKRQAPVEEVMVAQFTSWTKNKTILMNEAEGGTIYPNYLLFTI